MHTRWIVPAALALAVAILAAGCSGQPLTERENGTGVGASGVVVGNQPQTQQTQTQQTQSQIEQQQRQLEEQRRQIEQLQSQQNNAQ